MPARHELRLRLLVEREVELEHVHARLAEKAERASVRVLVDEAEHLVEVETALTRNPLCLCPRVRRRDLRVESRPGRGDGVDRAGGPVRRLYAARRSRTAFRSSSFVGPRFDAELDIAS